MTFKNTWEYTMQFNLHNKRSLFVEFVFFIRKFPKWNVDRRSLPLSIIHISAQLNALSKFNQIMAKIINNGENVGN